MWAKRAEQVKSELTTGWQAALHGLAPPRGRTPEPRKLQ